MGTKNGHVRHPTLASICVRWLLGPANALTTSGTWVVAPHTLRLLHERRLKSPSCWVLQYCVELAPLSAMVTPPPSAIPPVDVGTMFHVVLTGVDCSVVPLSWLPQNATPATASNAQEVCSVTWMLPLMEVQSPELRAGVWRLKMPPSSDSRRSPAWSKTIVRESECGALPPVVWVWVIQVHWLPAPSDAPQRNIHPPQFPHPFPVPRA